MRNSTNASRKSPVRIRILDERSPRTWFVDGRPCPSPGWRGRRLAARGKLGALFGSPQFTRTAGPRGFGAASRWRGRGGAGRRGGRCSHWQFGKRHFIKGIPFIETPDGREGKKLVRPLQTSQMALPSIPDCPQPGPPPVLRVSGSLGLRRAIAGGTANPAKERPATPGLAGPASPPRHLATRGGDAEFITQLLPPVSNKIKLRNISCA